MSGVFYLLTHSMNMRTHQLLTNRNFYDCFLCQSELSTINTSTNHTNRFVS